MYTFCSSGSERNDVCIDDRPQKRIGKATPRNWQRPIQTKSGRLKPWRTNFGSSGVVRLDRTRKTGTRPKRNYELFNLWRREPHLVRAFAVTFTPSSSPIVQIPVTTAVAPLTQTAPAGRLHRRRIQGTARQRNRTGMTSTAASASSPLQISRSEAAVLLVIATHVRPVLVIPVHEVKGG